MNSSINNKASARYAKANQTEHPDSQSTTATQPAKCAAYSASHATAPSGTSRTTLLSSDEHWSISTVLNGKLTIHDIRDVEGFVSTLIIRSKLQLNHEDRDDLKAYLISEAWNLARTWRPGPSPFSTHAGQWLPRRITDWQRQRKDTRYPSNTRYTQVPLNDQLAHTHTISPLDDQAHSRTDQQRLHHQRDRSQDRPYPNLDRTPTRTAA
jgi:hypothetical protein